MENAWWIRVLGLFERGGGKDKSFFLLFEEENKAKKAEACYNNR